MTPLDPTRWRRLQPILDEVLDLPAEERRSRLDAACAGDEELRREAEALLAADAETRGVLDAPSGGVIEEAMRSFDPDRSARARNNQPPDSTADVEKRLLPGARIAGRYRIVSLLGRGGMGEVYRADDLKLGQAIALKFIPIDLQDRPDAMRRLLDEAKLARQVAHPNVCRVYDVGEWHDRHFLSMEYIDGEDLASLIKRIGHLPRQKALDIARQLCAGLEAAHQLGILHRDLKPSNVMLDGNGRVRVTDFGLAVATMQLVGRESRAGTPGYMAPEQLDGREATLRSDVYALGLVLYELFTGRRAFQAASIAELRRLQEESSPTNPSALVENFDPAVERAILRCLEKDPALRPASAREVALLLPGGDPLAAAIAAGETPSPELVAASGPEGALTPTVALGTLGVTIAMLVVLVLLNDRASVIGWVAWPRSPDALEDSARGMLERLGHTVTPVDRSHRFHFNGAWMRYVLAHNPASTRWDALRDARQFGIFYFYRQASRPLAPLGRNGVVNDSDPPPAAGDAWMLTDLRGRLISLYVLPDDAEPPVESAPGAPWPQLFREADLDPAQFEPIAPTRNPYVTAEQRAAWKGTLSGFGGHPVRVEAAAHRGKPVFFELVVPWDAYWDPSPATRQGPPRFPTIGYALLFLFIVTITGLLTIRNWTSGRGDLRGASRLAAAVLMLRFGVWILGGHHVSAVDLELNMFLTALGKSLTAAAATWCFYVALEPHARRLHPRLLISWTRFLRGRVRDPLIGRDILYGVALSTLVILFWGQLFVIVPHAFHLPAPPPMPHPLGPGPYFLLLDSPPSRALLGGRYVLEAVPAVVLLAIGAVFSLMLLLLGLHMVLRRPWAAASAIVGILSILAWPSSFSMFSAIGVACSFAGAIALVRSLRFSLVTAMVVWFCVQLWLDFPITAKLDAPHFGIGLVGVLLIAALAAYGAFTASARGHNPLARSAPGLR